MKADRVAPVPDKRRLPAGVELDRFRDILGVRVRVVMPSILLTEVDHAIAASQPLHIAFFNTNLANFAYSSTEVADALGRFVVVNDGIGVDLASRFLHGGPFPANMNGTDFIPYLLDQTKHSLRISLVGGRPEVLEEAARVFSVRWPRHTIVSRHHGFFDLSDSSTVAFEIRNATPHLVLVAMGNPRQELWIAHEFGEERFVTMGVGAFFDFVAGVINRAPMWMRVMRIEWLFRLVNEPRRLWNRYLIGSFQFMSRVIRQRYRRGRVASL